MIDIKTFYDEHPINEIEILSKIRSEGKSVDALTPADLYPYDQDHYGGVAANEALATALALHADVKVLDLCSGMGGPARYLAATYGCRVHGVDLNASRVAGARHLTELVGLSGLVCFSQGDVAKLEFESASFDAVISQEAFLHVAAKKALLIGAHRVLVDGGQLGFTDWTATSSLTAEHRARFAATFAAERILNQEEYRDTLEAAGFGLIECTDLSTSWREILRARLTMFRSLEAETIARFGQDRHDTYIINYEFFIERIDAGDLGGARFIARK